MATGDGLITEIFGTRSLEDDIFGDFATDLENSGGKEFMFPSPGIFLAAREKPQRIFFLEYRGIGVLSRNWKTLIVNQIPKNAKIPAKTKLGASLENTIRKKTLRENLYEYYQ